MVLEAVDLHDKALLPEQEVDPGHERAAVGHDRLELRCESRVMEDQSSEGLQWRLRPRVRERESPEQPR